MKNSPLDIALIAHDDASARLGREVRGAGTAMRVALAELATLNDDTTDEDSMRVIKRARSALRRGLGA